MASRQAVSDENLEGSHEQGTTLEHEPQNTDPGIFRSILRSVGETYGQVKEDCTSKKPDIENVHGQSSDESMGKAGEYTDYAADIIQQASKIEGDAWAKAEDSAMHKAKDYKDYTVEKAKKTKDAASEEAGGYKDYAVAKAKEAADTTMEKGAEYKEYMKRETDAMAGRIAELKESAAVAARRDMDLLTGKTGEADRTFQGGDKNEEKYGESEFAAREKMREMKLNEEDVYDKAKQRAAVDWETAAERGIAARKNIYGAQGSMKESIKDKLTYPTDIVQQARASGEYGGPKRAQPKRGEQLVVDIGEGPSEPAATPTVKT